MGNRRGKKKVKGNPSALFTDGEILPFVKMGSAKNIEECLQKKHWRMQAKAQTMFWEKSRKTITTLKMETPQCKKVVTAT